MLNIWNNLDWSVLTDALISAIPALICITLHECAHGVTALCLGDTTARDMGRLSLNPMKHFDIMGFIMMAFVGLGWAKPVPVDMRNFNNPRRDMAITAVAGPVSNILITLAALFLYGLLFPALWSGTVGSWVLAVVYRTAYLSLAFAVFNIVPIPPLDGSKVLGAVMSDRAYWKLMRYERYGMILLVVLVLTGVISGPVNTAVNWLFERLYFASDLGFALGSRIVGLFG